MLAFGVSGVRLVVGYHGCPLVYLLCTTAVIIHPRAVYTRNVAIGVHAERGGNRRGTEGRREGRRSHGHAARHVPQAIVSCTHTATVRAIAHPGEPTP